MFVPRLQPLDTITYTLHTNGGFGMINLGDDIQDEIERIDNHTDKLIDSTRIHIYFPAWEHYYLKTFHNENGFTLKEILSLINDVGTEACGESWKMDPSIFTRNTTYEEAADSVGEFGLCDLQIKDNHFYINVDH